MKQFSTSLPFVIFFLVMVMVLNMVLGQKAALWFLALVALGMVVRNADQITALMDGATQSAIAPPSGEPTPDEKSRAGDLLDWGNMA